MLGYKCCGKTQVEHSLNKSDLAVIKKANSSHFLRSVFYPITELPEGVNLNQPRKHGLSTIDKFYTSRNLLAMSHLWRAIHRLEEPKLASVLAFVFTSLYQRVTRLSEFRFWDGSGNTARFNVPFIFNEANVFVTFERKAANILDHLETTAIKYTGTKSIVCGSATNLHDLPDASIDFIGLDHRSAQYLKLHMDIDSQPFVLTGDMPAELTGVGHTVIKAILYSQIRHSGRILTTLR